MLQVAENILLYNLHEIINRNSSQNQKFQKIGYKHLFIVKFCSRRKSLCSFRFKNVFMSHLILCHYLFLYHLDAFNAKKLPASRERVFRALNSIFLYCICFLCHSGTLCAG